MANIRLRSVERLRRVSDVLRGKEHAEGQSIEEVSRREQASHRAQSKSRALMKEARDISGLRNVVFRVTAVLLHQGNDLLELGNRELTMQSAQLLVDNTPSVHFALSVLDHWQCVSLSDRIA